MVRSEGRYFQCNNMCDGLVNFNTDWLVSTVSLFRVSLYNISIWEFNVLDVSAKHFSFLSSFH